MPSHERLVICGPGTRVGTHKGAWSKARRLMLDVTPGMKSVRLQIRDITDRMAEELPAVAKDLVEIASYVYVADQACKRGSDESVDYRREWRRRFRFVLPVRAIDVWRQPNVIAALRDVLTFLSDDDYEFAFVPHRRPGEWKEYLEFPQGSEPVGDVDEVMLFSGGLDSLSGAVEEGLTQKRKVALVSHTSVTKVFARQWQLVDALNNKAAGGSPSFLHIPVLVNKREALGVEYTQRTRSFLFASIGAAVARLFARDRLRFYENGIVSCNLPISAQVIGGRASRTTHPRVLNGYANLFSLLFDRPFAVENPFFWKTRADVISRLRASGHADLAAMTVSCAGTWHSETDRPHCGVCSQCVDRRLAALSAGLSEAEDPPGRYRVDLFTGALEDVMEQTMVERIIGTAREVEQIATPMSFLQKFGEATRLLRQLPGHAETNAVELLELHRRHAQQVNGVVHQKLASALGGPSVELPATCLLRMLSGPRDAKLGGDLTDKRLNGNNYVPDDDELEIIEELHAARTPRVLVDLEQKLDVSRATLGRRIRRLATWGLVRYPKGLRKGVTLSDSGRKFVRPSAA